MKHHPHSKASDNPDMLDSAIQSFTHLDDNYHQTPFIAFSVPSVTSKACSGMVTGPPGESGNREVKISTPSSVTSKVCSTNIVS
jgi:hypothetical protein